MGSDGALKSSPLESLIEDAIIVAARNGHDVSAIRGSASAIISCRHCRLSLSLSWDTCDIPREAFAACQHTTNTPTEAPVIIQFKSA